MRGGSMRQCLPSMAPKQCGKLHLSAKSYATTFHSFSELGIFKYNSWRIALRARQVSFIMPEIVLCPSLKFNERDSWDSPIIKTEKIEILYWNLQQIKTVK